MKTNQLLDSVANYYSERIVKHGETPLGVDWNSLDSQTLRFEQLSKIINNKDSFSVNDLGCGYGALHDSLSANFESFSYTGIDISAEMVTVARNRYQENERVNFLVASEPNKIADYGIASGIFNVRLDKTDTDWKSYIETTLDILDRTSKLGFSFNCLTSYSDTDKIRDYLYYANPCVLFDLCKKRYSKNISLIHDYGLYEFTILVRKSL